MKKTEEEMLNDAYIKTIIGEFNEEPGEDKYLLVFGHLMLRMAEGGKAPMPLMNVTRIAWDLSSSTESDDFEDLDESDLYIRVKGDNGKYWIPLFTDRSEIGDIVNTNAVKEVPIRDIIRMAHNDSNLNGVLINPRTDGFTLPQEYLAIMLDQEDHWKEEIAKEAEEGDSSKADPA